MKAGFGASRLHRRRRQIGLTPWPTPAKPPWSIADSLARGTRKARAGSPGPEPEPGAAAGAGDAPERPETWIRPQPPKRYGRPCRRTQCLQLTCVCVRLQLTCVATHSRPGLDELRIRVGRRLHDSDAARPAGLSSGMSARARGCPACPLRSRAADGPGRPPAVLRLGNCAGRPGPGPRWGGRPPPPPPTNRRQAAPSSR